MEEDDNSAKIEDDGFVSNEVVVITGAAAESVVEDGEDDDAVVVEDIKVIELSLFISLGINVTETVEAGVVVVISNVLAILSISKTSSSRLIFASVLELLFEIVVGVIALVLLFSFCNVGIIVTGTGEEEEEVEDDDVASEDVNVTSLICCSEGADAICGGIVVTIVANSVVVSTAFWSFVILLLFASSLPFVGAAWVWMPPHKSVAHIKATINHDVAVDVEDDAEVNAVGDFLRLLVVNIFVNLFSFYVYFC